MGLEILGVVIWGGIVAMDTTAVMQIMISHPIVSCTVVGLLMGNLPAGFFVGVLLELPWLIEVPSGTARFAEGNIGSTSAAAIAIILTEKTGLFELSVCISIVVGVLISVLGGFLVIQMRKSNDRLMEKLISSDHLSPKNIIRSHLAGVAKSFVLGAGITALVVPILGAEILPKLIWLIPDSMTGLTSPVFGSILGVGCAVLTVLMVSQKAWWLLPVGLAIGGFSFIF